MAAAIQERLDNAPLENIRTFRTSLNVMGDGFAEAVSNTAPQNLAAAQPAEFRGTVINVPVVEAGGALGYCLLPFTACARRRGRASGC